VNLTGKSKNFKMLDFLLNKLKILSLTDFIFSDLNYKVVIFLSQTESTPKHFFRKKKALDITVMYSILISTPFTFIVSCYCEEYRLAKNLPVLELNHM
jgi:hypothetical protein